MFVEVSCYQAVTFDLPILAIAKTLQSELQSQTMIVWFDHVTFTFRVNLPSVIA